MKSAYTSLCYLVPRQLFWKRIFNNLPTLIWRKISSEPECFLMKHGTRLDQADHTRNPVSTIPHTVYRSQEHNRFENEAKF